jgi:hypothetical protein
MLRYKGETATDLTFYITRRTDNMLQAITLPIPMQLSEELSQLQAA